jgi:hypothetical protein
VKGFLTLLVATLLATGTAGAAGAAGNGGPHFSPSIYPTPVAARTGALSACPNPRGLEPFTPAAVHRAVRQASGFTGAGVAAERLESDRSFWPQLRPGPPLGRPMADEAQAASGTIGPGHIIIGHSCGTRLLGETETVVLIPLQANGQPQDCLACRAHFYYIDRLGHALLYFLY